MEPELGPRRYQDDACQLRNDRATGRTNQGLVEAEGKRWGGGGNFEGDSTNDGSVAGLNDSRPSLRVTLYNCT
jgi:hypothetical protein